MISLIVKKIGGILGTAVLLQGCYVLSQAYYQNNLYNSRQPIVTILASPSTSPELSKQLKFVNTVLAYAQSQGIANHGSYEHFISLEGPGVSYLVYAVAPFSFTPHTYTFPIVGTVPYKGFFYPEDRDDLADELTKKGLDVYKGVASAFSSLGYYDDPIYSSMLKRDQVTLAHTLFHELTHKHVWIKGSVLFNENLAEFVAYEMTKHFLMETQKTDQLEIYETYRSDRHNFRQWLLALKQDLTTLYESPQFKALSEPEKHLRKQAIFQTYVHDKKPQAAKFRFTHGSWNNARLYASNLYSPDIAMFQRAYACLKQPMMGPFLKKVDAIYEEDSAVPLESLLCPKDSH